MENFDANIYNTGTISSDSLNLRLTESFTHQSGSFNGFTFNNLGIHTDGSFTNSHVLNLSGALTITVADFDANIYNTGTISSDSLNLRLTESFTHQSGSFNGFTFNNLGIHTDGSFLNKSALNVSGALTITVADFDANISNDSTISADALNLTTSSNFTLLSNTFDDFTFNNLAITTAGDYTQIVAIDIAGDLRIQVSGEARLDDTASIKAKNLLFSAYDFYNQADFTITDNATFDIGNDFGNGFVLDGTRYGGGNISAGNFNVTAGNYFYNSSSSTINADDFNVTLTGRYSRFYNYESATINVDDFNVTLTGRYSRFYNYKSATINANNFNVTGGSFSNYDSATINADDFNVTLTGRYSRFYNYESATINVDDFNVTLTGRYSRFYF